ncbi:MAG: AmmeMemoRadiSam system protein B [Planctomycetales bacterium]|nr:AmmeMemoRadiSam system protein B [Planctomycetales bacterium]
MSARAVAPRVREPCRAGSFYPAEPGECRREVARCLEEARRPAAGAAGATPAPANPVAGLVPHAGWAYSGPTAARVFLALASASPRTVVFLGTVHVGWVRRPSLWPGDAWRTPLGDVPADRDLAAAILDHAGRRAGGLLAEDARAHEGEHAIEVQVPFVQQLLPEARIVAIGVPPGPEAPAVGVAVAEAVRESGVPAVVVASSDLTHYGADYYGFAPEGEGPEALAWARANDRRLLDLVVSLRAAGIVEEGEERRSACGPGAIAAGVSAAQALGSRGGVVLAHTNSHEVRGEGPAANFVGYAGVVF